MDYPKIELAWYEILQGATTGVLREVESIRKGIKWGHGFDEDYYQKWGKTISGSLCEMALAKYTKSFFTHSVNNFHGKDIIINKRPVQVRSQLNSKPDKYKSLIVRQDCNPDDYYFYIVDDLPTFYICGYIKAKFAKDLGYWTNFKKYNRPYVWSIPPHKLKPIDQFKYES